MVTAELAIAIPTLLLVLSICMGAVAVVAARVRCIDAAAVAARLTARGETRDVVAAQVRTIVPSAVVTVRRSMDGFVEVDVRQRLRLPVVGTLLPGVTVAEHLAVPDESLRAASEWRGR
jgi:hypothetical protein